MRALGERLLESMLSAGHMLPPDALAEAVRREARSAGAADARIHLVDYEQVVLVRLATSAEEVTEPLGVDTTLVGRAFTAQTPLEASSGEVLRLLAPLVDGTERIGVLELSFQQQGGEPSALSRDQRELWIAFTSLVAELLVTKTLYGDVFVLARRRRDMNLAAEMQWALLPPLTFSTHRFTISGVLEPAYELGGDAFDYALNGDICHLALIDAMGHGLEASLLATLAIGAYRHARRRGLDLPDTFASMDEAVATCFDGGQFVTANLVELDCSSGRLTWLNAGHPPPLLARGGRVIGALESPPAMPVGLGDKAPEVAERPLEPGDRLLFFSDGIVEARSSGGEPFGVERLADLLVRETASGQPAAETMRRLSVAVLNHRGGALQDDGTMLFLEWLGSHPPPDG